MTLKRALIATAIWTVLMVSVAGGSIWYVATHPLPGVSNEDRGARLGRGLGMLMGIGYGTIWLPYAAKVGTERRAKLANAKKRPRKRSH